MKPDEMIKILKSELKEYKKTDKYKVEKYVKSVLKDMTEEELYPNFHTSGAVSYTHLTLPTIYSV